MVSVLKDNGYPKGFIRKSALPLPPPVVKTLPSFPDPSPVAHTGGEGTDDAPGFSRIRAGMRARIPLLLF